jgi:hypothetical protein
MMFRPRRPIALPIALLVLALTLGACVTEYTGRRPPPPGLTRKNPPPSSPQTPVALPTGKVAQPAGLEDTLVSRVVVSVIDLGSIPYDGLVLPLVSPDGRFVAAQSGQAPTWPTIIASPDAEPAVGTLVTAYSIPDHAPTPQNPASISQIPWPAEPPPGLLLGRSCDDRGFLVESPQEGGARWIGRIDWVTGALTWLVRTGAVNAHAVLGPSGELAFTRRPFDTPTSELVFRPQAGNSTEFVFRDSRASLAFPVFTAERAVVYALVVSTDVIELVALRLPVNGVDRTITVTARRQLARSPQPLSAYQATAALQVPLPALPAAAPVSPETPGAAQPATPLDPTLPFFHPALRRMCVFNRRTGSITPLPPESIAAVPSGEPGLVGYFTTSAKGLTFSALNPSNRTNTETQSPYREVSVLSQPLIPRRISNAAWPFVLLGPDRTGVDSALRVYKMRPGNPDPAAEK